MNAEGFISRTSCRGMRRQRRIKMEATGDKRRTTYHAKEAVLRRSRRETARLQNLVRRSASQEREFRRLTLRGRTVVQRHLPVESAYGVGGAATYPRSGSRRQLT